MKNLIVILIICVSTLSCTKKKAIDIDHFVSEKDTSSRQVDSLNTEIVSKKSKEQLTRDSLWIIRRAYCSEWHRKRKALLKKKKEIFLTSVYQPSLNNKNLPNANLHLLNQIKEIVDNPKDPQIDLFPIYRSSPTLSYIEPHWSVLTPKRSYLMKRDSFSNYTNNEGHLKEDVSNWNMIDSSIPAYITHPELGEMIDSLGLNNVINIFSPSEKWQSDIENIGFVWGDCRSFDFYQIRISEQDTVKKPIIGSILNIELELSNVEQYDSLHYNTFKRINDQTCTDDCLFRYEQSISFGTLKGIDNLYLSYTEDALDQGKWIHYPQRSIGMIVGDTTVIELWKHTKDNFGCSCL
jgi:hypothetical protein